MPEARFCPDWSSAPGRTISDLLALRGGSERDWASSLSLSTDKLTELICGRLEINEELAERLQAQIGSTREFWMRRERDFRDGLMNNATELLRKIKVPLADVLRFGWLTGFSRGDGDLLACARFLGICSSDDFEEKYGELEAALAFRRSDYFQTQLGALVVWFRAGQLAASELRVNAWKRKKFEASLSEARVLTRERNPRVFVPTLQRICAKSGVALVVVQAPRGCPASGATYSAPGCNPLIILSSRHLSDDHFWFSFFHEAAHVLLHGDSLIVESNEMAMDQREEEANAFASAVLIPTKHREELFSLEPSRYAIARFARKIGVAPGVIVGQLQHAGVLRHNQLNTIKRRYRWRASLEMR